MVVVEPGFANAPVDVFTENSQTTLLAESAAYRYSVVGAVCPEQTAF
jgi:hypothetical protein